MGWVREMVHPYLTLLQDELLATFGAEIVLLRMRLLYIHSFAIFIQSETHRRYPPILQRGHL